MPEATANGGTSRRARLRRAVLRLLIASGAIVAVWLIAPSAASADEPSGLGDLLGGATDVVGDTVGGVTGVVDDVVETTTETVEQVAAPVEQVTGVATGAVEQVTGVATGAVEQVADDATGTVEEVLETATGTVEEVLETTTGTVEETIDAVTATSQDATAGTADEPPAVPDSREATGAVVWQAERRPVIEDPVPSEVPAARPGFQAAVTSGAPPSAGVPSSNPGPSEPGPGPFAPGSPAPSGRSSMTDIGSSQNLRSPSSNQDVGVLATLILIALALVRWSRREAELRPSPVFLSLLERPG